MAKRALRYRFSDGICFALLDVCQSLAFTPDFCAESKVDATKIVCLEDPSEQHHERFVDYRPAAAGMSVGFPLRRVTTQKSRQHLGDILFDLALRYVSLHEQGHVHQGHLHFLSERTGSQAWMEHSATETRPLPNGIEPAEFRALELQADAFASHVLISRNAMGGARSLFPRSRYLRSPVDWLFFAFLSAAIVYALLERADASAAILLDQQRNHPAASIRIISAFAELRQAMFTHIADQTQRTVFIEKLLVECAVIFRLIGVQPVDADAFNTYFAHHKAGPVAAGAEEIESHHARLTELLPTLRRLSTQAIIDFEL